MSRKIPMVDLSEQTDRLWPELEKAVHDVLRSGRFILGPNVEAFEREAASFLGTRYAVGVGSGTDALVLALRALGVGPGDEVIVPSFTFFATAEAVSLIGAKPVFADIEPTTYCLEPESVKKAIGLRTRAIIPVHLFGHPAEMDAIGDLARARGLAVLEDAAQAFGATYRGRKIGGLGNAAAFSFFPSKNLGAFGEAGLIATDDAAVADSIRSLRAHGSRQRYHHTEIGYNARLDEIQAALLRVKLPHVPQWNDERRRVAATYDAALAGVRGVTVPRVAPGCAHVFHQYTVRVPAERRAAIQKSLEAEGISTQVYYPIPNHALPMYAQGAPQLPETEAAAREVLSLPIYPELSDADARAIAKLLTSAVQ
ncbi:MAG TPA: DegT/DnrJ/EryC1/StrS family aminotransferase [Myxococcota bacterium]|nr:DegT/DnrJ/EryC1/StrS family aminotransferase [Myxococcota bacterium]